MSHEISQELVARLVALCRELAAERFDNDQSTVFLVRNDWLAEARAIVAELPAPVNPDVELARQIVSELFPLAAQENEWALLQVAHLAIRRTRELASSS